MENTKSPYLVEIDGLCEMLSIGKNTAYKLLTEGEVDSFKIGSVWKIPIQSIEDYINRKAEEMVEKSKVNKKRQIYHIINKDRDLYYERNGRLFPIDLSEY